MATQMAAKDSEQKTFSLFIEKRRILIADPSASARSGLYKVFAELGAKPNQITLVNSYKQAAEQIAAIKPHIVIAEYELGSRCGLDLLQTLRESNPTETKQMIFVVVTRNTSQSAVARSAEEDIDAYILKPFTVEMVRKTIMKAAIIKIKPPEYLVAIDEGKALLSDGKTDEAEKLFIRATGLDPQPALALYYLGQIKFLRQIMGEAHGCYNKGLEFNKIHYKCLVGLYELLMSQKNHNEAYDVVKKVSQYFPANPKRLTEVLRLAIITGKYEDVEKYYSIFVNIDERDEVLIRYVCAALVVCGKYYLGSKNRSRALELFQKAASTGYGRVKILKEIIQALLESTLIKEARDYLNKFPPESHTGAEFLITKFLISNAEGNLNIIIEQGRKIVSSGFADEKVFAIMIQRSKEAKLDIAVDQLLSEAVKKYPQHKDSFEKIAKSA
jgi:CheY-like chemotaxis protein